MRLIDAHDIEYEHICGEFRVSEEKINAMPTIFEISDNATNGEVLKTLFPNERIGHCEDCTDLGDIATFDDEWWNALYNKGGK